MSYGGSSVIVSFACIGLVANIHMRRFSDAVAGASSPLAAVLACVALSCSGPSARRARSRSRNAKPRRSTTTTTSTSTTTTTTTAPPAPVGLRVGASGPEVLALQQRLAALKYDVPRSTAPSVPVRSRR